MAHIYTVADDEEVDVIVISDDEDDANAHEVIIINDDDDDDTADDAYYGSMSPEVLERGVGRSDSSTYGYCDGCDQEDNNQAGHVCMNYGIP